MRVIRTAIVLLVVVLPLVGAVWAGRDAREFLQFPPPLEIPSGYLRFSWFAAVAVVLSVAWVTVPWLVRTPPQLGGSRRSAKRQPQLRSFPVWGWWAVAWTAVWWLLAWTRWEWFAPLQRYTFFPLWIGFIIIVNAAIERRTGTCLMRRATRRWIALFGVSAVCWWGFEWLNRFVQNWHYLGAENFGPSSYAVHATLCFSTVLPAVAAIAEWIASHGGWNRHTTSGPKWGWLQRRGAAAVIFVAGVAALVGTGAYPRLFYPGLWVAPLALFLSAPVLARRHGLADEIARGDWTRAATWMAASLGCGFFWELWNWQSMAKWIYTVPGVERWHVFEMPLLGYVGYLPFGLECLLVAEGVIGDRWRSTAPSASRG